MLHVFGMDLSVFGEIAPFYLFSVIAPIVIILWQLFGKNESKFDWIVRFVFGASFFLWVFFLLPWSQLNYYLRYIFPLIFLAASVYSFQKAWMIRIKGRSSAKRGKFPLFKKSKLRDYLYYAILLVISILFLMTCVTFFKAQFYPEGAVELEFPLRGGEYYFIQAGSNVALNSHYDYAPQRYAYDIVKLDSFGFRAKGFLSENLSDYYIYDEIVYAPCAGIVLSSNNSSKDMPFYQRNEVEPNGNNVVLGCGEAKISLIHFKKGSVLVSAGQLVTAGQPIGMIGNSGRTTEPHLHIHAENKNGEGIPIAFNGRTFVRNDILSIK